MSDYLDYAVMVRNIARQRMHENLADFIESRWELISVRATTTQRAPADAVVTYRVFLPEDALFLAANALAADGYETTLEAGTILMERVHVIGSEEKTLLMMIHLRKEINQ